jgi:archaeal type IV pilus assembly protein PilA
MFMKKTLWRSKKGISTIIATIIIVSVSIVMAIAVAYWAMGIGNAFQKYEKVEFVSVYSDYYNAIPGVSGSPAQNVTLDNGTIIVIPEVPAIPGVPANYTINIVLKNTGSAAATINNIFLNGRPYDKGYTGVTEQNLVGYYLAAGAETPANAKIFLPTSTGDWSHGNSVDVVIQTAAGRSYSNTVVLP